jgi:hypothetical protein
VANTSLDATWLSKARQSLEALRDIYGFDAVDVHPGPLVAVRSVTVSWTINKRLSYVSLALPVDGTPHEYSDALAKLLYSE